MKLNQETGVIEGELGHTAGVEPKVEINSLQRLGFYLQEKVGVGGYGNIYRTIRIEVNEETGEPIRGKAFTEMACKVIRLNDPSVKVALRKTMLRRWSNEVKTHQRANHTNIVKTILIIRYRNSLKERAKMIAENPVVEEQKAPGTQTQIDRFKVTQIALSNKDFVLPLDAPLYVFIFMELANGDLNKMMESNELGSGLRRGDFVRKAFSQIASGLEYLHSIGIAHRDIKPQNIVYMRAKRNENNFHFALTDFGLVHLIAKKENQGEEDEAPVAHSGVGTMQYMAPEVLDVRDDPQAKAIGYNPIIADVFSLGIILCYMQAKPEVIKKAKKTIEMDNHFTRNMIKNCVPNAERNKALRDLIYEMFTKDPNQRITMQNVLNNQWVKGSGINLGYVSMDPPEPVAAVTHSASSSAATQ